ncbi:MAG: hypothetical protein DYG98_04470 [Haliscomenobacteraceae bacterium CHB4]|nr:hypothetical protein [Haliscomenobacteraceae bacterium CHB4]
MLSQKDYKSAGFPRFLQAWYGDFWKKIFCFEKEWPILFCCFSLLKSICETGLVFRKMGFLFYTMKRDYKFFFTFCALFLHNKRKTTFLQFVSKNVG